ncbi:helix-turn-helix domain-containing protein [Brevibacillus borstelensis]|uniref:helix-turn-helix domain-containing protein n=1 Tax=Brevibacillus borstelensis TaxID=45462 RepID=UPI00203E88E5|nr:helix-turn-helix transcriptional regulator [Brevibacillus borstelensis]MCM3624316.1 helix-turn-helix domain-containing protein [Brevibacillus borstelensis]
MKDEIMEMDLLEEDEECQSAGFRVSENFGLMIKHYRKLKNLSLKELEQISGVSAGYINRLEHNLRRSPSITKILQITDALQIPNSVLVATIIPNSRNGEGQDTLSELLIKNDFVVKSRKLNGIAKDLLIRINEYIADAEWSSNSKLRESYELSQLIDQLKEAM